MAGCVDVRPHPLSKHRLLFGQKWWIEETLVSKREKKLRDALDIIKSMAEDVGDDAVIGIINKALTDFVL